MKLIIAIVNDDIAYDVIKDMSERKIRATKLSSTGGFMKKGNTTLLIGVDDSMKDEVLDALKEISNKGPHDESGKVANINAFVLNMSEYKRV